MTRTSADYTVQWLDFILAQNVVPQTISTSYADDEQTGKFLSRLPAPLPVILTKALSPRELCQARMRRLCAAG